MKKALPELIAFLENYNCWRRGSYLHEQPVPKELGRCIDQAVEILKAKTWQPMETAPKDGSEILAAVRYPTKGRYETFFLYWITTFKDYPDGVWAFDYETPLTYGEPAYWMETPEYVDPETES